MAERLREIFGDEDAWVVGGAIRDGCCYGPFSTSTSLAPIHARPRVASPVASGARSFRCPRATVRGASSSAASTRPSTSRRSAGGSTPISRRATSPSTRSPSTCDRASPTIRTADAADLEAGVVRAVSGSVFVDDPLRLLRAVRFEDELGFRMDERTESLVRASVGLVTQPAGERVLAEVARLSAAGYRRLDDVGLLAPLGGVLDGRLDALDDPDFRLVVVFGRTSRDYRSRTSSGATRRRFGGRVDRTMHRRARSIASGAPPSRGRSTRSRSSVRRSCVGWSRPRGARIPPSRSFAATSSASRRALRSDVSSTSSRAAAGTISTREGALALAHELAAVEAGP